VPVGVCTEHERAQRTHQKSRAEGHEREHQRTEGIIAGEKCVADGGSVITKHHEVVHLQKVSAGDADHGPNSGLAIGRIHRGPLYNTVPAKLVCSHRASGTERVFKAAGEVGVFFAEEPGEAVAEFVEVLAAENIFC
jgi:hypothetical protein